MIREYIIVLSKKQSDKLVEIAEKEGFTDELEYLQLFINRLVTDDSMADALTEGMLK